MTAESASEAGTVTPDQPADPSAEPESVPPEATVAAEPTSQTKTLTIAVPAVYEAVTEWTYTAGGRTFHARWLSDGERWGVLQSPGDRVLADHPDPDAARADARQRAADSAAGDVALAQVQALTAELGIDDALRRGPRGRGAANNASRRSFVPGVPSGQPPT